MFYHTVHSKILNNEEVTIVFCYTHSQHLCQGVAIYAITYAFNDFFYWCCRPLDCPISLSPYSFTYSGLNKCRCHTRNRLNYRFIISCSSNNTLQNLLFFISDFKTFALFNNTQGYQWLEMHTCRLMFTSIQIQ